MRCKQLHSIINFLQWPPPPCPIDNDVSRIRDLLYRLSLWLLILLFEGRLGDDGRIRTLSLFLQGVLEHGHDLLLYRRICNRFLLVVLQSIITAISIDE